MHERITLRLSSVFLSAFLLLLAGCSEESTAPDVQPPAAVNDLAVVSFAAGSVTLSWTAPGDDSLSGQAAQYDLRYSTEAITDDNWDLATQPGGPAVPRSAGVPETLQINDLPLNAPLYFALKTRDEAANWSGMSNTVYEDFMVSFPDSNLEAEVCRVLAVPAGEIPVSSLLELDSLIASNKGITDLSGLEHCPNLKYLILFLNEITDIRPLAGLTELQYLHLGRNKIEETGPLAGLTNLRYLRLYINRITDISPLAGLVELEYLNAIQNDIADLEPLRNLADLQFLYLDYNSIDDLSPLAGLTGLVYLSLANNDIVGLSSLADLINLKELHLQGNAIADIQPLVANTGLAEGDVVFLEYNPLSRRSINELIPALRGRGVTVTA
jgi:hypothetical protein